jgi:amino acid transporter/nucleotide-binding universal stress UspA family protein
LLACLLTLAFARLLVSTRFPVYKALPVMSTTPQARDGAARWSPVKVIIVSSVMFSFISYWRTAAVVLCDLASTAYYIGGIVEAAIGPAAPWFILAVMLFSYAVRSVYIESCSLFVRGGVYRVVKEALGGFLAKLSVSALMFDYVLTGPTSGVAAGQYIMGLGIQCLKLASPNLYFSLGLSDDDYRKNLGNWGAVLIACLVTIYFFRQNLLGIHESSDKALKIMIATTIMAFVMLGWCGLTLVVQGPKNSVPLTPDLGKKFELLETQGVDPDTGEERQLWVRDPVTGRLKLETDADTGKPRPKQSEALKKLGIVEQEDPLGFFGRILPESVQSEIRNASWISLLGFIGLVIAFGHSILAMSGEETLAQVYREVESPKLPNFKKAAFIVFVYSLVVTAGISFMAVLLIPDEIRMKDYSENLIGGLARNVLGPPAIKLLLEGFVVIVGFLILAGAVNTAMIGSNGVLNRVAEDGVLPDWFLKPHSRYGTTFRLLFLILGMQVAVILISQGDMLLLGEAYAFGVVWSFVFKASAMVVLRFKDRSPREYKVPLNIRVGNVEVPIGLGLIFLVLLSAAIVNFFTKEVATVGGLIFTASFLIAFTLSEHLHERRRKGSAHHHLEQFNQERAQVVTISSLGLTKKYRKVVAIRSTQNLFMLETALAETDPLTTDVVVMTAKMVERGSETVGVPGELDPYDQQLMTAVVERAEKAGKQVHPLIVMTNNPLHTILQTVRDLQAQEVVVGGSNKFLADEQMEQIAFFWITINGGETKPLTVRILSRDRDVYFDLGGGSRIPKLSERKARSVEDLRAAGIGVDRVLLVHEGTMADNDLFQAVLTMLDPQVTLTVVPVKEEPELTRHIHEQSEQLKRRIDTFSVNGDPGPALVKLAKEDHYDLIVLGLPQEAPPDERLKLPRWADHVLQHAHCRVFLASAPNVPTEVAE